MVKKKMLVLDTSVLIYDPDSIFNFETAQVGIPIVALEELDRFKSEMSDRGYHAREVIRRLDKLRGLGSLREGVKLESGGIVRALFMPQDGLEGVPFDLGLGDNAILYAALQAQKDGFDVVFVSKDLNARVKADVLGLKTDDYLKGVITRDHFFHGWVKYQVPAIALKKEYPSELNDIAEEYQFTNNEFVLLESQHNPYNYRVFRYAGGKTFTAVYAPRMPWPVEARNPQQLMALNLLFDPNIQLVTLVGPAGTGKTFLALLAGLYQVAIQHLYKKMLISRPVIPLGPDIGYLPGSVEEKLLSWMQPIYDNMELILHSIGANMQGQVPQEQHHEDGYQHERHGHRERHGRDRYRDDRQKYKKKHKQDRFTTLDDLIKQGRISLEAITYMRGRSIPYQYILIDEVQNLTLHEVKTLISRVGEGSKIILAGDPYQIDSPYLDFSSNGLMVAGNRFKGQNLFGTVYLENSERSELSKLVGTLL